MEISRSHRAACTAYPRKKAIRIESAQDGGMKLLDIVGDFNSMVGFAATEQLCPGSVDGSLLKINKTESPPRSIR